MRFVNLIVILQAIHARTDPIQPRDFDLGGDFSLGTESLGEGFSFTPTDNSVNLADAFMGGGSLENVGFSTSDLSFAQDSGLGSGGFSAESLDLANLIPADTTFVTPENAANVFATQPEAPAIVADVPIASLGVTDGDLIASANIPSDSIQFAGFLPGSENIEPFTPGPGTQDILNAADNPSFSTSDSAIPVDPAPDQSASSLDNLHITNVGFVAPPEGTQPFTPSPEIQDIVNAAENSPSFSTSDSPIAIDANLGSSTSSTDNPLNVGSITLPPNSNPFTPGLGTEDFTNPVEKPFSGDPNTFTSPIGAGTFGVGVDPATLSEGDLNLSTFKAGTERLATDVKLPPDMQEYFDRITKAPLTENDWKIISGRINSETPASGITASSQTLSFPATQALRGVILTPQSQRILQSNTGFDLGGIGSNFVKALITVAQTAIQKAVIQNSDSVVTQRVPVAVAVTQRVGVPVPVTLTLVRGVRVPVTVISTLPGGVVTRIIVLPPLQPTPSTLLTSKRTGTSAVPTMKTSTSPTNTPSPLPAQPNVVAAVP